jgi:hypothetical protein
MFLYFLQKKSFLNNDCNYLSAQLRIMQKGRGRDIFFRHFLLRLLYEGLGRAERTPALYALFGNVPYLGHDLFTPHEIECNHPDIVIPDLAFETLFAFFNTYHWHLDECPLQHENDINPGILGYLFEKYINQHQMGAYYTREDVTEYIAKNTLIPYLFDHFRRLSPSLFGPDGTTWQLLQQHPDRYIQREVSTVAYLPTETAREYTARRRRYSELRNSISMGKIRSIDDFITYNLDICNFSCDVIRHIETPALVTTCYEQLKQTTLLDPTCGAGAFLFAALNILVPLYEACLERMDALAEGDDTMKYHALQPTDRRYVVLKTIITNNLYGVDIMEEAVEICKLRLFLKLVVQIRCAEQIEPLPYIMQHIRTGNALVGFITSPDLHAGTSHGSTSSHSELDALLASTYQVSLVDSKTFEEWRNKHKPFHWFIEFGDIMHKGGFHIIIGNPPYVEYNQKKFSYRLQNFATLPCTNLYTCVIERSHHLLSPTGRHGMILPLAAFATKNMIPLLEGFRNWFPCTWLSFYHFRPSMLFSGENVANIPTAIYLAKIEGAEQRFSTHVAKWFTEQRHLLFSLLTYCQITAPEDPDNRHYYPKFGHALENTIMEKVLQHKNVSTYLAQQPNQNTMYYRSAGGLYWKVFTNFSWPYRTTSNKVCSFQDDYERDVFVALFNSSLFWWYYTVTFDTFNLKDYMVFGFRFTYPQDALMIGTLQELCRQLMEDYQKNARHLRRGETGSYTVYAQKAKPIIDKIDHVLAQHYRLTQEELDFILHYDIKYRMGGKK